ncbi:DUF6030 family protein [Roseibium marinum]|uniref:Uncharacterized protein n=1 Tax=Roseibium marinum TaxID=281252 RepID=A0A2S3UNA4_9HYPH|nr:DUF6030 family protein [Roseibium marinum]POF29043.1 hypothetical protein CLV41_11047 [Roseibium marinum]
MAGWTDRIRQLLSRDAVQDRDLEEKKRPIRRTGPGSNAPHWAVEESDPATASGKSATAGQKTGQPRKSQFVTHYYVWGTLAFLLLGSASGVLVWRLKQGPGAEATGPRLSDPLLPLGDREREELLNPSPELSAELKRGFHGKPSALCAELHDLGLENPGWKRAPFQPDRWQCASDLVALTTPSVDYGSTTLFFLLRGPSQDKIDYLRLKLVVEDPKQKQIGLDAVWLVIDALATRYGWTVPGPFRQAISGFEKLETIHRGVRLSVAPEDPKLTGDPWAGRRLNIILNFGEPDLIRPADRFEKAPPLESGWSVEQPGSR